MGLPEWKFPYTNVRDINLDWIIKTVKNLHNAVVERLQDLDATVTGMYILSDVTRKNPLVWHDSRISDLYLPIEVDFLTGGYDWTQITDEQLDSVNGMFYNFTLDDGVMTATPDINWPLLPDTQAYAILIPRSFPEPEPLP